MKRRETPKILNFLNRYTSLSYKNFTKINNLINDKSLKGTVLVVGGGELGNSIDILYKNINLQITTTDIYKSDRVDVIANVTDLPFNDMTFDIVIVQSVLQYVEDYKRAISEITRVSKKDAIIYIELPWMQAIVENDFEYWRFTPKNILNLFENNSVLEWGVLAGTFTSLRWSIRFSLKKIFYFDFPGYFIFYLLLPMSILEYLIGNCKNDIQYACSYYFLIKK